MAKKHKCEIEKLDFQFVSECKNKKELERIIKVLRSGEEGSYPALLEAAEKQLKQINPESILLRTQVDKLTKDMIATEKWNGIEKEVGSWESNMQHLEEILKKTTPQSTKSDGEKLPVTNRLLDLSKSSLACGSEPKPTKKVTFNNYEAWDKFDVEKALLEIDINSERSQELMNIQQKTAQKGLNTVQSTLEIKEVNEDIQPEMRHILSNQSKEKGNEYFKACDWHQAYHHYSQSIIFEPNIPAYNNRAMTNIKLQNAQAAISDCNWVLKNEPCNVKALLRRGTARKLLKNESEWKQALNDFATVIEIEPNNKLAQSEYSETRKKLNLPEEIKKIRLKVDEYNQNGGNNTANLPLTFYAPSTSSFSVEPYSGTHRLLAGPSYWGPIPCCCYRRQYQQNPLCRYCGERDIAVAKRNSIIRFNQLKEQLARDKMKKMQLKTILNKTKPTILQKEDTPLADRSQNLAKEARDRGNICLKELKFAQALAYFSTSIRLFPHTDALKGRSYANLKCKKYLEAVEDCTKVLAVEPNNIEILLRRAEAYRSIAKEPYLKYALEDLTLVLNLSPANDVLIQKELIAFKNQLTASKERALKSDINANETLISDNTNCEVTPDEGNKEDNLPKLPRNSRKKKKKKSKIQEIYDVESGKDNKGDRTLTADNSNFNCTTLNSAVTEEFHLNIHDEGQGDEKKCLSNWNFFVKWNSVKDTDANFLERLNILKSIPPHQLPSVLGMKLDADLLADILRCLEIMKKMDLRFCASYLENLIKVQRFEIARMMLDSQDFDCMTKLLSLLPNNLSHS